MTITGNFRGSKRINPRPRGQTRSGKLAEVSCGQPLPSALQLNKDRGPHAQQVWICVISQLATRHVGLCHSSTRSSPHHAGSASDRQLNFKLAGWTMSRKHGLATFDHEGFSGPLLINLWTDQLLSGFVWMLMAWKSSTSISHQHRE